MDFSIQLYNPLVQNNLMSETFCRNYVINSTFLVQNLILLVRVKLVSAFYEVP